MSRPVLNPGTLVWSGEHWVGKLRRAGAELDSATLSLVHTRFSPAGEGNAALVRIPGADGFNGVCCDNRELCAFVTDIFFRSVDYFDETLPTIEAQFARGGDIRGSPSWSIRTTDHALAATWRVTEAPIIAAGSFREGTEHFTILFFTDEAHVALDGRTVPGRPYLTHIWEPTIGGERSSCVFALAETLIELPE